MAKVEMGDEMSKRLKEVDGTLGRLVDFVQNTEDAVAAMVQGTHAFVEISTAGHFKLTFSYKVREKCRVKLK